MRSVQDFARVTDPTLRQLLGAIRRMAITLTAKTLWQLVGYENLDGTDETTQAEPFTGIGFYARPPANGKPEAIVLNVGGSKVPVVVATRDERTRKAMAGSVEAGGTMVYSSAAVLYLRANGTVEVRTAAGAAVALATLADVQALRGWAAGHKHTLPDGTSEAPLTSPPEPSGTSVLRGE